MDGEIGTTRVAQNQSLYRSINERVRTLNETLEEIAPRGSAWVCECADTRCTRRIAATLTEYEAVRANPRAFLVYSGHVYPEVERILDENDRFTTVEKIEHAGRIAESLDPRRTS